MAQNTLDDLKAVKGTDFFLLNKKLQIMKEQLQKQKMLSATLKERIQLNNNFIQRLTEKLIIARTGETTIEESEEVEDYSDDGGDYLVSELPLPLEKLAVEVNIFMRSARTILSRSFVEDKEEVTNTDKEYSLKCYSEYSDFEEESLNKSPKENEKPEKIASTVNVCEICGNDFSWYIWRHRCKYCGRYSLN